MKQLNLPTSRDESRIDFATLDLLPYGIIVVDEDGVILYYNAREEEIANRRREEVLGKNFFSEVAPCAQVREFYGRFKETMERAGLVADFHFHFPFPERPREVEITLTSFQKDDLNLCLISVSDVTEKDVLREHLVRGARLREVGEVAAGVAHNFNNLLTVIRGNAELLLMHLTEDAYARGRVEKILKASDDGEQMIGRIRESARHYPEAPAAMTIVQLNELVKDSIAFTEDYAKASQDERGAHVRFKTVLANDLPPVLASASELREVFVNLLRNAVDAIEGDGQITARTHAPDEHGVVVEIKDTGAGMSREVQEKIFRPLFTTKGERGTGLGLATCYAILRRHGGDIEVKSAPGKGTNFIVRLPAASRLGESEIRQPGLY
jgi:photoactive yellow protein